jgi:hypothetical protein
MSQYKKLLIRIIQARSDRNISFSELIGLLEWLGFNLRIRGDHHILSREGIEEIINLQPKGGKVKPYQVKQVRNLIIKYGLAEDDIDAQ